MRLGDALTYKVIEKLGFTISKDTRSILDGDGFVIEWTEQHSMPMLDVIDGEYLYCQINLWGDFTLEFQDTDGESINWSKFSTEFLEQVLKNLNK